jgi:hypothetical protein
MYLYIKVFTLICNTVIFYYVLVPPNYFWAMLLRLLGEEMWFQLADCKLIIDVLLLELYLVSIIL